MSFLPRVDLPATYNHKKFTDNKNAIRRPKDVSSAFELIIRCFNCKNRVEKAENGLSKEAYALTSPLQGK